MSGSIGGRIQSVRERLSLSQSEFGNNIAASASYVSMLERGVQLPDDFDIRLIVSEYGVNYDWLLTGNGEMIKTNNKI